VECSFQRLRACWQYRCRPPIGRLPPFAAYLHWQVGPLIAQLFCILLVQIYRRPLEKEFRPLR